MPRACGRSSVVERMLPKHDIVGSNPIARSGVTYTLRRGWAPVLQVMCLPRPVCFTLRAVAGRFGLLIALPLDRLTVPIAAGSGLAFALVTE